MLSNTLCTLSQKFLFEKKRLILNSCKLCNKHNNKIYFLLYVKSEREKKKERIFVSIWGGRMVF